MSNARKASGQKPRAPKLMSTEAQARIYRATAVAGDGTIPAGSFAARAARAADANGGKGKAK